MGNIINIDEARPHITTSIECGLCGHKWIAVYPEGATRLECPNCHDAVNEYGTSVYVNRCKICGREFTICPKPENTENWQHCLAADCLSYDESRDADKLYQC